MRHNSTKSNIMVSPVPLSFADIYQKPYIASEYIEDIRKADILVIPSENIREDLGPVFPEFTSDFFRYLKEQAPANVKVDIAVDDEQYHRLVLHSQFVALATLMIKAEVLEEAASLVTGFLQYFAAKNRRFEDEMDTFVNIIVEGAPVNRKIMFRGRVSELKDALKKTISQVFRGGAS